MHAVWPADGHPRGPAGEEAKGGIKAATGLSSGTRGGLAWGGSGRRADRNTTRLSCAFKAAISRSAGTAYAASAPLWRSAGGLGGGVRRRAPTVAPRAPGESRRQRRRLTRAGGP